MTPTLHRLLLTGGPCSGKTTLAQLLRTHYTSRNYTVLIVPEAATILLSNGISFNELDEHGKEQLQCDLLETIKVLEVPIYLYIRQYE